MAWALLGACHAVYSDMSQMARSSKGVAVCCWPWPSHQGRQWARRPPASDVVLTMTMPRRCLRRVCGPLERNNPFTWLWILDQRIVCCIRFVGASLPNPRAQDFYCMRPRSYGDSRRKTRQHLDVAVSADRQDSHAEAYGLGRTTYCQTICIRIYLLQALSSKP